MSDTYDEWQEFEDTEMNIGFQVWKAEQEKQEDRKDQKQKYELMLAGYFRTKPDSLTQYERMLLG